ncbi:hypothetical protein GOV14_02135 [Candidatus Pacearchaeota archaeon]|nr:hypothetical protein [Candidatus Pacearchaeota archaeon]
MRKEDHEKKEIWENIGFDESNNGYDKNHPKLPAIYVTVSSDFGADLQMLPHEEAIMMPKPRKSIKNQKTAKERLQAELDMRDYSYLLLTKFDCSFIDYDKRLGIIMSSLLSDQPLTDHINLYVDGIWSQTSQDFTKSVLHDVTGLERDCITLVTGADLDRRASIVSLADQTAYWLLNKSIKYLQNDNHRRELLPDFKKYLKRK